MRRLILWSILSFAPTKDLLAESVFPESIREIVTRVCGFCHYPDFFDDVTGELIEERFLDKPEVILDRLQRPVGSAGRMPPKRSPVSLTEEERLMLITYLGPF